MFSASLSTIRWLWLCVAMFRFLILFRWSTYLFSESIPDCFYYYHFVICLEIWNANSTNIEYFSRIISDIWSPLWLQRNFRTFLIPVKNKMRAESGIVLNLEIPFDRMVIFIILILLMHEKSSHFLVFVVNINLRCFTFVYTVKYLLNDAKSCYICLIK